MPATDFNSIEELIAATRGKSIHIECGREAGRRALEEVRNVYGKARVAYYVEGDRGFGRDTVRSYLRFFSALAGGSITAEEAIAHFGLKAVARTRVEKLSPEQRTLMNLARLTLFEPEVVFCERPLAELGVDARHTVLAWMGAESERGTVFVTVCEPLREALLMPGEAWWEDEGRFFPAQIDDAGADESVFAGDEVRICKIQAKTGTSTLFFDPREIDFVESLNRQNFVSVRGELYQTPSTLDELEEELSHFGFFRCHRSYIVNVQKVARVERYTRNSFNLTLSDAAHTSIPLAKGRAEEMRATLGWK